MNDMQLHLINRLTTLTCVLNFAIVYLLNFRCLVCGKFYYTSPLDKYLYFYASYVMKDDMTDTYRFLRNRNFIVI